MAAPREVGVAAMENVEVGQRERAGDDLDRCVDIARAGQHAGGLGAVGRLVEPGAGFDQRLDQREQRVRIAKRPGFGRAQHLLRHRLPDVMPADGDPADAERDRLLVPRLADAVAVDHVARQMGDHVRRRHDGKAHVAVGIEAARGQPEAQQVIMRGEGEDRRQSQRRAAGGAAAADDGGQGATIERGTFGQGIAGEFRGGFLDLAPQRLRQGDGVAVEVEGHGGNHRRADAVDPERCGERHGRQHLGGIEQADRHLVADRRPRRLAPDLDFKSLPLECTERLGEHDRRAIDQGDDSQRQLRSFQIGHYALLQNKKAPGTAG